MMNSQLLIIHSAMEDGWFRKFCGRRWCEFRVFSVVQFICEISVYSLSRISS